MKIFLYSFFPFVVLAAACTSYAKTIDKYQVSQEQIDVAKKRWETSDSEKLKAGKSIFIKQCSECHKPFVIEKFSEKKWKHEIEDMSPKAKLTAEEKENLTQFVLSYLEIKTQVKK